MMTVALFDRASGAQYGMIYIPLTATLHQVQLAALEGDWDFEIASVVVD